MCSPKDLMPILSTPFEIAVSGISDKADITLARESVAAFA